MNPRVPTTVQREAPNITFDSLALQPIKVTPITPNSRMRTAPEETISTVAAAKEVERVVAAHYGYVPEGFKTLLSGAPESPEAK
ncbi:hypothetical protein NX059_011102 [Plenodomus lindquistii]|nr:hypothetical protein NX059_011102 [Plenodomus lindquistii]